MIWRLELFSPSIITNLYSLHIHNLTLKSKLIQNQCYQLKTLELTIGALNKTLMLSHLQKIKF